MDFDTFILSLTDLVDQCRAAEQSATITYSRACQLEKAAELHYRNEKHAPARFTSTDKVETTLREYQRIYRKRCQCANVMRKLRECRDYLDKAIDAAIDGSEV